MPVNVHKRARLLCWKIGPQWVDVLVLNKSRDKLWRELGWLKTWLVIEKRQEIVSARSLKLAKRPLNFFQLSYLGLTFKIAGPRERLRGNGKISFSVYVLLYFNWNSKNAFDRLSCETVVLKNKNRIRYHTWGVLYVAPSFKRQCRIENLKSVLKIRILASTTQTTL